ncbi:hypothetical protein D9757_002404 [Collybiopsis confluens]|uniref:Uncharacterized protein n=1 Tax=Collybiopsis confluens TaxID=2823264 RepID=A0A8H5HYQ5_9AGAR|nr:hypothetical protein D9757_002404 [Collybiopsis confluens]
MNTIIPIFAPEHRVKSVTIFKSTNLAEVVRTFDLELKPGSTKISITGLSSVLDPESVRVTGLGTGALRLHDVICTTSSKDTPPGAEHAIASMDTKEFLANIPASLNSTERIRLLNAHLKTLESEKQIRDHESNLLVSYAKTLQGEHIQPEQMSAFLSTFVEIGQKSIVSIREIDEMIVAVRRRIELEEQKLEKKKGAARTRVEITIGNGEKDSGETRRIELKLTYLVANVKWEPTYELHAHTSPTTGQPSSHVTLHYRASVIQSSGEDWTDAALTLSTGSSIGGLFSGFTTGMPALRSIKIKPIFNSSNSLFGQAKPATNFINNATNKPSTTAFGSQQLNLFGQPVQNPSTEIEPSAFGSTAGAAPQRFPSAPAPFGANLGASSFGAQSGGSTFGSTSNSQPASSVFGTFGGGSTTGTGNAPQQQQQPQQSVPPPAVSESQLDSVAEDFEEITFGDPVNPVNEIGDVPLSETQTVVTKSPITISYSVAGLVSIPSDGVKHHVGVAVLHFDDSKRKEDSEENVKVEYGVVPRIDAKVYLQCRIKNTSEYTILPGSMVVILDDTFVTRTSISHITPNATFSCTLGSDSTTSVTYRRTSKNVDSSSGSFAESFKITTYTTTVTLHNRHTFDLKEVRVWDAVPMWTPTSDGDKKRVSVVLRKPHGLADAKDGQPVAVEDVNGNERDNVTVVWEKEKEGKFYWKVGVKAGKSEQLVLEWEVKAPTDLALVEGYGTSLFG